MTATTNAASLEHPIGLRGRFALRVPAGDVVVRAVEGEIARVRDRDGRSLAERFKIEADAGSLSLRAPDGINFVLDLGFLRKGSHANLEIELPRLATVQLETASADVRAAGLEGKSRYRTASGELTLTAAGGSIDIEAVSGDVNVTGEAAVSIGCRTVSGEVTVRASTLTRLEVKTTSGDIRATGNLAGEGPFSLDTVSGDAVVVTSSGLRVEAKTVAGDIRAPEHRRPDHGPGHRTFSVGNGRTALAFRSISGDLRISNPRDEDRLPDVDLPDVEPVAAISAHDAATAVEDPLADERLELLRALERGEISVEGASLKLAALDAVGEGGAER